MYGITICECYTHILICLDDLLQIHFAVCIYAIGSSCIECHSLCVLSLLGHCEPVTRALGPSYLFVCDKGKKIGLQNDEAR